MSGTALDRRQRRIPKLKRSRSGLQVSAHRAAVKSLKQGLFKESSLLLGPVMVCFKVCLPVDHLGILSRS